jgi:hypothetical protein
MGEFFQSFGAFFEYDSFSGYRSTSGELFFFKIVKDILTLVFRLIGKEDCAVPLEIFGDLVTVRFMGILLFISKSNSNNFIFAHEKLRVGEGIL